MTDRTQKYLGTPKDAKRKILNFVRSSHSKVSPWRPANEKTTIPANGIVGYTARHGTVGGESERRNGGERIRLGGEWQPPRIMPASRAGVIKSILSADGRRHRHAPAIRRLIRASFDPRAPPFARPKPPARRTQRTKPAARIHGVAETSRRMSSACIRA